MGKIDIEDLRRRGEAARKEFESGAAKAREEFAERKKKVLDETVERYTSSISDKFVEAMRHGNDGINLIFHSYKEGEVDALPIVKKFCKDNGFSVKVRMEWTEPGEGSCVTQYYILAIRLPRK